jgi:translation initiation factor IF-2
MDNKKNKEEEGILERPPVVAVLGHIDHGKSTLLDSIRKINTTEKEFGGITQHISAYETEVDISGEKRRITFLDTPGHEAFCTIRERGSAAADIVVLVVSAEDSVKPQTIEAIKCIKQNNVPFVVAANKIDKPGADVNKLKQDLAENEVFVEGWGGNVPLVSISAKSGQNIEELLEMIVLQADLEEIKGDSGAMAEGFCIESSLNPREGISATLIIKNGTLRKGEFVATENAYAPVRAIENYKGEKIDSASFSSPVKIVGWSAQPMVGGEFKTFKSKEEAENFVDSRKTIVSKKAPENEEDAFLPVIIKADTIGSLDAAIYEMKKIKNDKISVKVIGKGVGPISENDVKMALVSRSPILGFCTKTERGAESLALRSGIEIKNFNIIYELLDWVSAKLTEITPVETVEVVDGTAKILRSFSKNKDKQVLGGRVEEGEIKSGSNVKIVRRSVEIGEGKIREMQSQKIKADSASEGSEFGVMIESKIEIVPGDYVKAISFVKR